MAAFKIDFYMKTNQQNISGVKYVVAVASGKGGVGKSSVCFSLALAAQKSGLKVGLLDADIYGPSLPTLLGINQKPQISDDKKIIPLEFFNLKVMSIGFLVPPDSAVIWRGLMVQQATNQLLADVKWNYNGEDLDILFIDLPPGTGDVQLTMAQKINIDGSVIVSTYHSLSLSDVNRAIKMFEKLNVPILGCVENMASFTCSNCNHKEQFSLTNKVEQICNDRKISYLGELPHDMEFAKSADSGIPFVLNQPNSFISKEFDRIFSNIWHNLNK